MDRIGVCLFQLYTEKIYISQILYKVALFFGKYCFSISRCTFCLILFQFPEMRRVKLALKSGDHYCSNNLCHIAANKLVEEWFAKIKKITKREFCHTLFSDKHKSVWI